MKPVVKLNYVNFYPGFDESQCRNNVLMDLCSEYQFEFTNEPDILLIGCYGCERFDAQRAIKIGYYTENLPPDLDNFDYFFGWEFSETVSDPRYCKGVFGPLQSHLFRGCADPRGALQGKTRFCNFIYTTKIPFRERFYSELSHYKEVSAPGKSMNNCNDLASRYSADWQSAKLRYLGQFKFTIAFENSRREGYVTEKLFDALTANTIPIYWGDPKVKKIVNADAIIEVGTGWDNEFLEWLVFPERRIAYRPLSREPDLFNRLFGRLNDSIKLRRATANFPKAFKSAVETVVELDQSDEAFCSKLAAPRLLPEVIKLRWEYFHFWHQILSKITRGLRRECVGGR